ncbi:MAG TPA: fatty acid desaturase [Leptolyngbyaceae cyanobacterium M33_DOE_097]|uniref:Fatty acid desaturase n=1 Tax=Oscillatoriales cyanobacterium SpSt-418 TaxID=2282169 RepID=A0A7C3KDU8_9CYAN|nr:fatty acid desaturase [Leptolyngbyaceae cyanobacterium M33_DOE_097]
MANPNIKNIGAIGSQSISFDNLFLQPNWDYAALAYILGSYISSIGLLLLPSGWANGLGVIGLTHSLVLSAYMTHEFIHRPIFSNQLLNWLGRNLMGWLNGSYYIRFQELRKMHLAHHTNRIDYCRFQLVPFLKALPPPIRWFFLGSEWLYFPSLAFLLRIRLLLLCLWKPHSPFERIKLIFLLVLRLSFFLSLGLISLKALLLYFLAYCCMLHILRFMDAFQHTYESTSLGGSLPAWVQDLPPQVANVYEQANTYSYVISQEYAWLNYLLLNFGYHNAHHQVMYCPWYHLSKLDRAIVSDRKVAKLPFWKLLKNYHRFRVSRIFMGQGEVSPQPNGYQIERFFGAIEVSFLVIPK